MAQTVTRQELDGLVGRELGVSDWFLIDQERVNAFADVTLDHQFVHVDPERRASDAVRRHDRARLSDVVAARASVPAVHPGAREPQAVVNYGFDKVRFSAPVKVGKRIRAVSTLGEVSERKPGNVIMRIDVTVEVEGENKPALVAEWLSLHVVD